MLVISIHMAPELDYPHTAGFADQVGGSGAEGTILHIPLLANADWSDYSGALGKAVSFTPQNPNMFLTYSRLLRTKRFLHLTLSPSLCHLGWIRLSEHTKASCIYVQ